ncbi:hypothetical protein EC957_009803 [Mortierella hygrophila]|uniref:Uncharacterized protein n=1 Tax=Mortierella hygrophila TaxID=979708 RepID=A0A9P6JXI2_9FUNG|nr:hypothetical protein EC957_009803 [Mortierella hygrophila]
MDDQFRMKSVAIGMAKMSQSQNADYICSQVDKIVKDWELDGELSLLRPTAKATGGFLEKWQEIMRFFKSCGAAKKALDMERARVNNDVYRFATATETCWNSMLTLMRRVHELAGEMAAALEVVIASPAQLEVDRGRKMTASMLSELEREEVSDLCKLLTPAAKLTHEVSGSKYPTISSAYSKTNGLTPALTTLTAGPAKEMSDALIQEIELRFTVHQMPEVTLVAMFLNLGCPDYEFSVAILNS